MHPIYEEDENNENEFASRIAEEEDQNDDDHEEVTEKHSDDSHKHAKAHKKPGETHIVLNHKRIMAGILLFLVVLVTVTAWQLGYFGKLMRAYSAATVTVTVVEKDTHKAIANAIVKVANHYATTDAQGIAKIEDITSGEVVVEVSKDGYVAKKYSTTVYRGLNPLSDIVLEKAPEKIYDLSVTVRDSVTALGVKGAKVTIGDKTISTDDKGIAAFKLRSGATQAHITIDGYIVQDATVAFASDAYTPLVVDMVPQQYIVYEQEKGGKIDLYSIDVAGGAPVRMTDGKGVSSNSHPLPAPDQKYLAFLSDRDGVKVGSAVANRLYLMDDKGVVTKATDDNNPSNIKWITNTTLLYSYVSSVDNAVPVNTAVVSYNVVTKKRYVLSETPKTGLGARVDVFTASRDGLLVSYHQKSVDAADAINTDATGVYTVKPDGTLRKKVSSSVKSFHDMYFSADAKMLYYTYNDSGDYPFYQIDLTSGSETLATSKKTIRERNFTQNDTAAPKLNLLTQLTSDAKKYVYIDTKNGKSDVFVANVDGSGEVQITTLGTVQAISLSANDLYVIATTTDGASSSIYLLGTSGGTPRKITDVYSNNVYFSFKPVINQ